jgi:hypothetical protein
MYVYELTPLWNANEIQNTAFNWAQTRNHFSANTDMQLVVCGERNDTKLTLWRFKLHIVSWGGYDQTYTLLFSLLVLSRIWIIQNPLVLM